MLVRNTALLALALSTVVVLAAPSGAMGQGPQGPQGPGGPGGRGESRGRGPMRLPMDPASTLMGLLRMPEVREELSIGPAQAEKIDVVVDELQQQAMDVFRQIAPSPEQDLDLESRERAMAELGRKIEETNRIAEERIAKVVEPEQLRRLKQLQLQRLGPAAFERADVVEQLQLTDEQKAKVAESQGQRFRRFGPPMAAAPDELKPIIESLTADQREKWTKLVGAEFKFPEPRGFGGPGFGPPGGMREDRKLLATYDKNGDGMLDAAERKTAREAESDRPQRGGFGGRGGPGGGGPRGGGRGGFGPFGEQAAGSPGPKVSPADVEPVTGKSLYDPTVLRTLFFEIDSDDWEAELEAFHGSDVDVPATLIVDGQKYENVGLRFRGMSSYRMVPRGSKRSLNVSMDMVDKDQRLYGYKTLNLLNAHSDPTFLHTVLYSQIARRHIAAPKANLVRVVVNGESWGVFANAQQFDKIFLAENFASAQGTRWKVPGSPGGDGGLRYLGENLDEYKRRYDMKSNDGDGAWKRLVDLCRTLNETPIDQLEAELAPMLDIDGALWFLALDVALINGDGYWTRASDYNLFCDVDGKFHVIPHDMNEAFQAAMGPGMGGFGRRGPQGGRERGGPGDGRQRDQPERDESERDARRRDEPGRGERPRDGFDGRPRLGPPEPGERRDGEGRGRERREFGQDRPGGRGPGGPGFPGGPGGGGPGFPGGPGGGGMTLDPLVGIDDPNKPLRSRLLAVPALRERYLQYVRQIAENDLDWEKLGPTVQQYVELIDSEVEADTRKLSTTEAFRQSTSEAEAAPEAGRRRNQNLKGFAEGRRKYLLEYQPPK